MSNQKNSELLEKIVRELLEKMTFSDFKVVISEEKSPDKESLVANIETTDSNLLIGQYGVTLKALQHIARVILRRKTEEKFKFLLDVNNYLRQRASSLTEIAQNAARQAISEKKPVVLRPMSAYERRIVHLELSENENVKTESIGEGEERKIVIRPVGDLEKLEEIAKE
jgi:spoIIIJ-associated protein